MTRSQKQAMVDSFRIWVTEASNDDVELFIDCVHVILGHSESNGNLASQEPVRDVIDFVYSRMEDK